MPKPLLSIGMPSYRDLPSSAVAIRSAFDYCQKEGHAFILSDNSQDPAKEKEYAKAGETGMHYIKSPPCNAAKNWWQTFDATESEFVLMMGDDDRFFSFADDPDFSALDDHVVAIKPSLLAYKQNVGIKKIDAQPILSKTAQERVMENLKNSNEMNLGFFSFWRRTVLKSVMDLWMIHHPTKGAYGDWAAMHGLISSGTAVMNPSVCYFYNLENWSGVRDDIDKEVERHYTNAGLPAGSGAYQRLLIGIDSFIFIGRKDSPIPHKEREQAATACLSFYLKNYLQSIPQNTPHENAKEIAELSRKLIGNSTVAGIFDALSDVLDAIRPNLGKEYRAYYDYAIGKPWGAF